MNNIIENNNIKKNNYKEKEIFIKIINNELAYNKIDGIVYSHLKDLSGFFNKGKISISEDRKTFKIEVSSIELNQTIYKNFETYCNSKIHQFRKSINNYNKNTLTAPAYEFEDLPATGNKIHKNYNI